MKRLSEAISTTYEKSILILIGLLMAIGLTPEGLMNHWEGR